jgi:hypothetical protein
LLCQQSTSYFIRGAVLKISSPKSYEVGEGKNKNQIGGNTKWQ